MDLISKGILLVMLSVLKDSVVTLHNLRSSGTAPVGYPIVIPIQVFCIDYLVM